MIFNRPPRIQNKTIPYEVKIPFPSQVPENPKINWLTLVLPVLVTGVIVAIMALSINSASSTSYLMFLPLMLVGVIVSVVSYFQQKKDYAQTLENIRNKYKEFIKEKVHELQIVKEKQTISFLETDPNPLQCIDRVSRIPPSVRLGERRPEDKDFLSLRVGLGTQPSLISIETPEETNRNEALVDLYKEVEKTKETYSWLEKTPISIAISEFGSIGIVGNSDNCLGLTRAMLISLTTHHWVSEVNLLVFCAEKNVGEWEWAQLLPHKSSIFSKIVNGILPTDIKNPTILALEHEIRRRESYQFDKSDVKANSNSFSPVNLPALIVVFDNISNIYDFAAFSLILEKSKQVGIYGIILSDSFTNLPGECGAVVEFNGTNSINIKKTGVDHNSQFDIIPDDVSTSSAKSFTKALSQIEWLIPAQITEPPQTLNLLELFDSPIEKLPIESWWDNEPPFGFLCAPIGKFSPTADLVFDLSEKGHGPHGIIGGTTGSGKSETLRSFIISFALTHHPYDLNFALIDFKGGAAFQGLEKLPHVVGVITDIENNVDYASRVIQSLTGEIKTRKQVLNTARERGALLRAHVDDYRNLPVRRPLPHLVIIFDEFAEFKELYPTESHQLVSIARVGRSLGIHLILCAQSPSAVVEDQIRQNSKFRICLPVSSAEDSRGFIGIPNACDLSVGEAYFLVKKPIKARIAYTGNNQLESYLPDETIIRTNPDGRREVTYPLEYRQILPGVKTEGMVITEKIIDISTKEGLIDLPKVWQPPIPEKIFLPELLFSTNLPMSWNVSKNDFDILEKNREGVIFGLVDDPINQIQPVLSFGSISSSRHLLVYGPSGSGKSTLLRTIINSIALNRTPLQAHIYCLDFGGQHSLKIFQDFSQKNIVDLPHLPIVGGIILSNENERIDRLFSMLNYEIYSRELLFQQDVSNLDDYNQKIEINERLPDIYLLIDGIHKQFTDRNEGFTEKLEDLLKRGGAVGIHIVITANHPGEVPEKIKVNINGSGEIIILKPVDAAQIQSIFGNPASESYIKKIKSGYQSKPGHGVINHNPVLEIQTALPVVSKDEDQLQSLKEQIHKMSNAWIGVRPPNVEILPEFVTLEEVYSAKFNNSSPKDLELEKGILIGVEQQSLKSIGFSLYNDDPIFQVLAETGKLGKTTLIRTFLLALAKNYSPQQVKFLIIDFHKHNFIDFESIPHTLRYVNIQNELGLVLKQLKELIDSRYKEVQKGWKATNRYDQKTHVNAMGLIVIVIDDYMAMMKNLNDNLIEELTYCIDSGRDYGIRLILSEDVAHIDTSDDILEMASKFGCGILLGGSDALDTFNETKVPGIKTHNLPKGRGYLIKKKKAVFFQSATFYDIDEDPDKALKNKFEILKM